MAFGPQPPGRAIVCPGVVLSVLICLQMWGGFCEAQAPGFGQTASHVVLRPIKAGAREVVMLIVPEQEVRTEAYLDLAIAVQTACPLSLGIGILDFNTADPDSGGLLPVFIGEALRELSRKGMRTDTSDIFLAGHGKGGRLVANHAFFVPETIRAIVLFGANLEGEHKAATFPVPVLTLTGDLDGINRITKISKIFKDMLNDANFDPDLTTQSPLVVLEGYNHAVYSSGELSVTMQDLDVPSEVPLLEGQRTVANLTTMFIALTVQEPAMTATLAKDIFLESFDKDAVVFKPILKIQDMTKNERFESYWVQMAQKWLSGLRGLDSQKLAVESYIVGQDRGDIIPPTVMQENNLTFVIAFSDVIKPSQSSNEMGQQAFEEIAARMVSPERIHKSLANTTIRRNHTCKDFNYASFVTAYHLASQVARARHDKSRRGIIFHDDQHVQSDFAWAASKLQVTFEDNQLHVTSPSYKTPMNENLGDKEGLYYCKLLPPDRAMEWIYVDSLRRRVTLN